MANFVNPKTVKVSLPINVKADGKIALEGDTAEAVKTTTIPGLKADCSLDEAMVVFNAIHGTIGGMTTDSLQAEKTIKAGVK